MEYQRQVAVGNTMLETVFDLAGEYELHRLIVMNPDDNGIRLALSHLTGPSDRRGLLHGCVRHVLERTREECGVREMKDIAIQGMYMRPSRLSTLIVPCINFRCVDWAYQLFCIPWTYSSLSTPRRDTSGI